MVAIIRGLHGKPLWRRELALNPVEPRAVGRRQADSDVLALSPRLDRCHDVGGRISYVALAVVGDPIA